MSESFFLEAEDPLAAALERARSLSRSLPAEPAAVDAAYASVLDLVASDDAALWSTLAAEHVSILCSAGLLSAAATRCGQYLASERAVVRLPLLLERAQVRSESGAHASAAADAAEIRRAAGAGLDSVDHARLRRVEGLAAVDRDTAMRYLAESRDVFRSLGDAASAAVVEADLRLLAARDGSEQATSDILAEPADTTETSIPRALTRALALRNQYRYEEALQVVLTALASDRLDDALRLPVLEELVALLVALRRGKALKALSGVLETLLRPGGSVEGTEPPAQRFSRTLLNAVRLVADGEVGQARADLDAVRELAASDRDRAYWHLVSGEVALAAFKRQQVEGRFAATVTDLVAAAELAEANQFLEVRIRALRVLGEAYELMKLPDLASECWATAHALEEDLVARQLSDEIRATLLEDIPNEHDERIRVAAERATSGPGEAHAATAVAATIVAMESARGAAILGRVAPDAERQLRRLPPPTDGAAAWTWLRTIADATRRDEAVWIMHARPHRVHHGIVGRGLVHHVDVPANRRRLEKLVEELRKQCNEIRLRQPEGRARVAGLIDQLAAEIGVDTVLGLVPRRIKRLVVVAGGVLSDIPLAALPITNGNEEGHEEQVPILCRFALSDLPCLSIRPLLHQRSDANRGSRSLLVSAFKGTDDPTRKVKRRKVLTKASPEDFEQELARTPYCRVRILGHGQSDPGDATRTWLQFAGTKTERDGRIPPNRFQKAALSACGTLILGACESGMAQRVGRDERTGFVRAGLHAGAASVVAARWVTEVSITAALLDRFEDYLRYLPRDVALRRAQLDIRDGRAALPAEIPEPGHPAWWACWTLYGDSGHQVGAPILRASARVPVHVLRRLSRPVRQTE
ncbi:CHAT domain-containing protein [Catenulispora sp. NF23]|uniref:CHAT domain-containing protein n=1 Tax=Catenulispora pinistramenti TaxID=2705254 RepID=UPI001BACF7C0|nr:CHAT domain-containing protein [Catenulispora pinistramenti]MBS2534033.1 CHAT domain-containing protein [Catenulispora pinistramenti]